MNPPPTLPPSRPVSKTSNICHPSAICHPLSHSPAVSVIAQRRAAPPVPPVPPATPAGFACFFSVAEMPGPPRFAFVVVARGPAYASTLDCPPGVPPPVCPVCPGLSRPLIPVLARYRHRLRLSTLDLSHNSSSQIHLLRSYNTLITAARLVRLTSDLTYTPLQTSPLSLVESPRSPASPLSQLPYSSYSYSLYISLARRVFTLFLAAMQLTWDLGMDHVRHWVLRGNYDSTSKYEQSTTWSSTVATGLSEAMDPRVTAGNTSLINKLPALNSLSHTSDHSERFPQELRGVDNDPLIPSQAEINRIFNDGRETWGEFVDEALNLQDGMFPSGLDPSIMVQDMPPLPDTVPQRGVLAGAPSWIVPDPEAQECPPPQVCQRIGPDLDLDNVTGTTKYFRLAYAEPLDCLISADPEVACYGNLTFAEESTAPDGLAIITMCWSYIFSTRLLQLQERKASYTSNHLRPIPLSCVGDVESSEIHIHLGKSVSPRLIHWLCAILSPTPGWASDKLGGEHSPWSARCSTDLRFLITTDEQVHIDPRVKPPSPAEAVELLIEFCNYYGISHEQPHSDGPQSLSPIKAGFLATLAIPFYRMTKLKPQLPRPRLVRRDGPGLDQEQVKSVRRYLAEVHYHMTLSMHPWSLGSVLWSIFWQPDIECNLVSPWLSAITSMIGPAIENRDLEFLAKVFSIRRPRVAMWWHGIFLLGNTAILDYMRSYLNTLDEGIGYDTLARPDIVAAVWTGAPQSFLDDNPPQVYGRPGDVVPRADLLQHRYTLTMRDPWPLFYGWRPFGEIMLDAIEPDLYPWLERGHVRDYHHWSWWSKDDPDFECSLYAGYRRELRRFDPSVPDRLELIPAEDSKAPIPSDITISLIPSRIATQQMVAHSLGNIVGERSVSTAVIQGLTLDHPWLENWRPT
ncbi:hypothetical protein G7046_g1598 [Stylonectria norvegica]|nr:hypothetical protein G7046_g1598 [Stylonectria norvegica]